MVQSLLFLGSSATDDNQLFQLASPTGGVSKLAFTGYSLDGGPITGLTAFCGQLYFSGGTSGASQLWSVSPLLGVATQITSSSAVADLQPRNLTVLGSRLYFSGQDAFGNVSLYSSDGTGAGTAPIVVAGAGAGGLVPDDIVSYGGRLYFSGLDATGVSRLWVSDGTSAGTLVLPVFGIDSTNLSFSGAGLNPTNLTVANGKLLFSGTDVNGQTGLWVSDGTSVGTAELNVSGTGPNGLVPNLSDIVSCGGRVYFAGVDASGSIGLWSSDGTAAGTTELSVPGVGANGVAPVSLTVFNGSLYFGGVDATGQVGLWKSDGTAAGTFELIVAGAGPGGLSPIALDASDHANVAMSIFGGSLYFSGTDASGTVDLWRSDGTAAGTVQVAASGVTAGAAGVLPSDLAVVDLAAGTVAGSQSGAPGPTIPASSLGTVPFATFAPVVVGSGPASIVLDVAEEGFQGDAMYTISVDGVQVGGTLTSQANYAAGQNQTVTVEGPWVTGVHTLAVDFLNDAYGGSASTNRNLYVALDKPLDAVGTSAMFLGYQGSQQIYVQAELTATALGGSSSSPLAPVTTPPVFSLPVTATPVSTPPVSTPPVSTPPAIVLPVSTSPVLPITEAPVATLPVATGLMSSTPVSSAPVATKGGTSVLPSTGTVQTVPGIAGTSTTGSATAVLVGTDSVSAIHAESNYIVTQIASATTYLTPKGSAVLNTALLLSNVVYSQGTDTIGAQGASDLVFASGPSATVTGGSGTLIFVAGGGNYTAGGGTGTDILYGGMGTSVLTAASGAGNILVAGSGNLTLSGGLGSGVLMFGGSGSTTFVGSTSGGDTMVGGTGPNVFDLTNGDIAFGGPASTDLFAAGTGSALLVEGGGATQVQLGSGSLVAFGGTGPDVYSVAKGLGGQATIVGFKAGDSISLTRGFTASDAAAGLKSASTGSFGTALSLSDGTRIVLSGVTLQASQLVVS